MSKTRTPGRSRMSPVLHPLPAAKALEAHGQAMKAKPNEKKRQQMEPRQAEPQKLVDYWVPLAEGARRKSRAYSKIKDFSLR